MGVKHEAPPNWSSNCKACGTSFERYVRPSHMPDRAPQYCSQECRIRAVFGAPKSREHRSKLGLKLHQHPNWKGDDVTPESGRCRALRMFPAQPCSECGNAKAERHHRDGNTLNNAAENISFLCRACHMREHARIRRENRNDA